MGAWMPSWNPAAAWNARRGTAAMTHPPFAPPLARSRGSPPGPPLKSDAANKLSFGGTGAGPNSHGAPKPPPSKFRSPFPSFDTALPTRFGVPGLLTEFLTPSSCCTSVWTRARVGVVGALAVGARAASSSTSSSASVDAASSSSRAAARATATTPRGPEGFV